MYGGLFGDLPAAKNEEKNGKPKAEEDPSSNINTDKKDDDKKRPATVEASSSLVQNLGVAGTAVAFVPTHIGRKRNAVAKKKPAPVSIKPVSAISTPADNDISAQANLETADIVATISHPQLPLSSSSQQAPLAVHSEAPSSTAMAQEEPEEIRRLHENVTDPYDPYVPNDLLQYWERKAAERERIEMEREAQETLERQRAMQQQIEAERTKMLLAGNAVGAADSMGGRGRGRGVSNLPAWLVKQKQGKEANQINNEGSL
jgi:hypothetical protein